MYKSKFLNEVNEKDIKKESVFKTEKMQNRSIKKSSTLKEQEYKGDSFYENKFDDPDMVYELELFLENDGQLYRQQFIPIIKNIQRKIKSGKYDHNQAPKLWMYYVENGLKKYAKELGSGMAWNQYLSVKDRKVLAMKLADINYDEIMLQGGEMI